MGRLLGISRISRKRGPPSATNEAEIGIEFGIKGDARGSKAGRQVTVLFREGWEAACRDLRHELPWTMRRANLYVEGVPVPREGARLLIGDLVLEVTQETQPCRL